MATRVSKGKEDTGARSAASELAEVVKGCEKRYGGIMRKGSDIIQPNRISTGIFALDLSILGGIPASRTSMYLGTRSSGKSVTALLTAAQAQKQYPDQTVVLLDIENTLDAVWAEALGVDVDRLLVVRPDTGEAAVDMTTALIQTKEVSLVIIDSIAALTPFKELDGSAEDAHVGIQARLVAAMVRKSTAAMIAERRRDHNVTLLFINQFRAKIGGFGGFGEQNSIPGGRALEYTTSVQVVIKNREFKGKDSTGIEAVSHNEHSFTLTKNKVCNGPRSGEFRMVRVEEDGMMPGTIDDSSTVLSVAKKLGVYSGGGGSWRLEFDDVSYKFGKMAEAVQALREDHGLYWAVRTHLIRLQAASQGMPQEFIERIQ